LRTPSKTATSTTSDHSSSEEEKHDGDGESATMLPCRGIGEDPSEFRRCCRAVLYKFDCVYFINIVDIWMSVAMHGHAPSRKKIEKTQSSSLCIGLANPSGLAIPRVMLAIFPELVRSPSAACHAWSHHLPRVLSPRQGTEEHAPPARASL
jgi:hypothetical protein